MLAQIEKEKGNNAFKAGEYAGAVGFYSAAIVADRSDATLPLNRAAAYLKLGKHADAERDCTTVLSLSVSNVKALFRRGQARVGGGKLTEARSDYEAALKLEPSNTAIKQELAKLKTIPGPKTRTKSLDIPPTAPDVVHPKRRRIPIAIVKPEASTSTLTSTPKEDLMKPVSSRAIPPSKASTLISLPATNPPRAKAPPIVVSGPRIRKVFNDDEKNADATLKHPSFSQTKETRSSSKPSHVVGGGIFRTSGEHTVFGGEKKADPIPSDPKNAKSYVMTSAPVPLKDEDEITKWATKPRAPSQQPEVISATPVVAERQPMSLFDFTRAWQASSDHSAKWIVLSGIPPSTLPTMFKMSLEPALLASMLETFDAVRPTDSQEYLLSLGRVSRFNTVVMFLSSKEKEVARSALRNAGIADFAGAGWAL